MRDRRALALGAALAAWVPGVASAQGGPPGCVTPMHRQFDFWVGEWTVTDRAGTKTLGSSRITLEDGRCAVLEHWTSVGGTTGHSINAWDPLTRQWSQDWVGSEGDVLHLRGGLVDGRMVLEGDGLSSTGGRQRNRVTWSPEPDGRVRQHWETSVDGVTWAVVFDGYYRRR